MAMEIRSVFVVIFVSMIMFALVGAITPGPVNIVVTSAAVNHGVFKALPIVLGASVAYMLVVILAGLGLSQWLLAFGQFETILMWISAGYLMYLSYRIATAPLGNAEIQDSRVLTGFWKGAFIQGLNPKAWLVASSGVSLFVVSQTSHLHSLIVFSLVSLVICLLGVGAWAVLGGVLQSTLSKPHYQKIFNLGMSLLLCGSVVTLLVAEYA
jgi:threonine/homoserine/homoserine lactone efflux protein